MSWPKVRLGDVCEINLGKTPPRGVREMWDSSKSGNCVWLSIADLGRAEDGTVVDSAEYVSETAVETCSIPVVKKGTLLLSFKLTLGRTAFAGRDLYTNEAIAALPVKKEYSGKVDLVYLKTYFSYFNWQKYAEGDEKVLGKTLNKKRLAVLPIMLPPLSQQRRIAASVDKGMKRVDAIERQLEKLRETAAACFKAELDVLFRRELFAGKWPMHMLREHVDVLAGYAFKGDSFSNAGIKICGGLIIMPDRIKWEECKHWRDAKGFETFLLAENDIVVALDRPWISSGFKVGKIEMKDLPCLLIQRTARLRARNVDPDFLLLLLRDKSFREHCSTSGTTVPHISHKDIETFPIPIPPMARQKEVVAKIAEDKARCDGIAALAARGLANCARMRKAILAEAFADAR